MEITECDKKGRIHLRESLRQRYGERFVVVEAPGELVLLPVPDDAAADLAQLGSPLRKHTIQELRARILRRARQEARP